MDEDSDNSLAIHLEKVYLEKTVQFETKDLQKENVLLKSELSSLDENWGKEIKKWMVKYFDMLHTSQAKEAKLT
jgi:hypothetical protein